MIMKLIPTCAAVLSTALALLPPAASAYCTCACISGKAQNVCSNSFDTEVYCEKYCPVNVLPPGSPQRNPDLEGFAAEAGKTGPADKLFIGKQ